MYNVDAETYDISLSKGDTMALKIVTQTDYEFAENDRAIFTIKNSAGAIVKEVICEIDENNEFTVEFLNQDTDSLDVGRYTWDVRYVINPYYNSEGRITDGDQVITPNLPMNFTLLSVVGEV